MIELLGNDADGAITPGALWQPTIGEETEGVLRLIPVDARDRVRGEAAEILGRCLPPSTSTGERTGLVVGYVQGGKTQSFTTVAALARDNNFPLVVLIAGTSDILLGQSRERLQRDLQLQREGYRRWQHFKSPSRENRDAENIRRVLADWADPNVPQSERPTVLITVMKNTAQLRKLADVLAELDLGKRPALVVDDEADQASLNTRVRRGEESSTYSQLLRVRRALPQHTLLQYTATPQAPLLISIADSLSPDFICVLRPGPDYIGGADFFVRGLDDHVRLIPPADQAAAGGNAHEPPDSLIEALRVFYLGLATEHKSKGPQGTRSVLIHPSRSILPHELFRRWVNSIIRNWERVLALDPDDPDRKDLVLQFAATFADLEKTVDGIPPLVELLPFLPRLLRRTRIEVVNATTGGTQEIPWTSEFAWILIGGQLMDRGYTVEGLTVTYMPREVGVGNADTLQQRARFYGYKRSYFEYCRVYLETGTRDALVAYVEHEQQMRRDLIDHANSGKSLTEWKRKFLLDQQLRPTRSAVISMAFARPAIGDDWYNQRAPEAPPGVLEANRELITRFAAAHPMRDDPGNPQRTSVQTHARCQLPLRQLFDEFLSAYHVANDGDSIGFTGVLLQLARYLDADPGNSEEICYMYLMSKGTVRVRSTDADDRIEQLFQGSNLPVYPGDRAIHEDALTVQVHNLNLTRDGALIGRNVPVLAVWVPRRMYSEWIIQAD